MDEVDNIIIHSLRQIGWLVLTNLLLMLTEIDSIDKSTDICVLYNRSDVDDDFTGLADLTPEHMVKCVARCLRLIRPDIDVPDHLPPGIAQRYSVTTELAESCAVCVDFCVNSVSR